MLIRYRMLLAVAFVLFTIVSSVGCASTRTTGTSSSRPPRKIAGKIAVLAPEVTGSCSTQDDVQAFEGALMDKAFGMGWSLVDRVTLDRILKEQKLQTSDLFNDPEAMKRLGRLSGASYILVARASIKGLAEASGSDVLLIVASSLSIRVLELSTATVFWVGSSQSKKTIDFGWSNEQRDRALNNCQWGVDNWQELVGEAF